MSYYFTVKQVHHRGQINFLIANLEFGDICDQFLKGLLGIKMTIQDVWSYFSNSSFIRAISAFLLFSLQVHCFHQPLNRFMVDSTTTLPQSRTNSTITVIPFIALKYELYQFFDSSILIRSG